MDKASKGTKGRGPDQQNLDFLGATNHHLERLKDLAVPVEKLSPDFLESIQGHISLKELCARVITLSEDGLLLLTLNHDGIYCIQNLEFMANQAELESKAISLSLKPEQDDLCSFSPDSQYLIIVQSQAVSIISTCSGSKVCSIDLDSFKQLGPHPKVEIKNTFNLKAAVVGKKQASNESRWKLSRFFDIRNALLNSDSFFVDIKTPRFFTFIGKDAIYVIGLPTGEWGPNLAAQAYFLVPEGYVELWKDLESIIMLDPFVFVTEKKRDRDIRISKLNSETLKFLYHEEAARDSQQTSEPTNFPVYLEKQGTVPITESRNILS